VVQIRLETTKFQPKQKKEPLTMKQISIVGNKGKRKKLNPVKIDDMAQNRFEVKDGEWCDSQYELISLMLPPTVKAFYSQMEAAVDDLCGSRYRHTEHACSRWGTQAGSIYLGNQKVAIEKPRTRNRLTRQEVENPVYAKFQSPDVFDKSVFASGIKKVSQRDYKTGLPEIAASFGMSKSQVSRSWVNSTAKKLDEFMNRSLSGLDLVTVFLDGKRFQSKGVLVALGLDLSGKKHVLGAYECSSENSGSCIELLNDLEKRGLPDKNLLFVVDGGSGLSKALREKYDIEDPNKRRAVKVRCYVHKWENLKSALAIEDQNEAKSLFFAVRDAKDLGMAKTCADSLKAFLKKKNGSALKSFEEAEVELLNVHRLNLSTALKKILSTTNPIENLNSLLEEDMRRVKRYRDSEHFRRWIATMVLKNESRMRRVKGHNGLPALKVSIQNLCNHEEQIDESRNAA